MSDQTLSINVSSLKSLFTDLRRAGPILVKEFTTNLEKAGDLVETRAKAYAAFSDRIPRSIAMKRRGAVITVQAGNANAPHAAALENQGVIGNFRHPVFGRDIWVNQPSQPFLHPALEDEAPEVEILILSAVDQAFLSTGWH